jgi:hypothetical protein
LAAHTTFSQTSPVFLAALLAFFSCANATLPDNRNIVASPPEIAAQALFYARKYAEANTTYELGGQDLLDKSEIKIDCSGLIVNCYRYALWGTPYMLLFTDAAVADFHSLWTIAVDDPRPGDFIFMGDSTTLPPTHMSLFVKNDGASIYFIDATLKPEDSIDGVSERYYPKGDPRFLFFGRLLVEDTTR